MTTRQKIGLRKPAVKTRAPGIQRRKALLAAAYDLLCEKDIEDVSFREIAGRADVPEGSAYHFFANRYDLFAELAGSLSKQFIEAHQQPVPKARRGSWDELAAYLVDVGAGVYRQSPPARQLLIGGKTPAEVKRADRNNDRAVGEAMHQVFARYFDIADSDEIRDAFFYFIEITDLIFMLSVIEHDEITPGMLREAKRAGVAYLATYKQAKDNL